MSNESERDEELFAAVIARPANERAAFLAQACGNDVALLARVASLVSAHETQGSVLDELESVRCIGPCEESPGDEIGGYKLLHKIGEGGRGIVWLAEEEPLRRRVALKVIKRAQDARAVVARFEARRQALAKLDHPNIAKVHEAGRTESGQPFFATELVRGTPITKYCDRNLLTLVQRVELLVMVCDAISHAHTMGNVHGALKPSKVIVTVINGQVTPKVIEFGIAKALQGELANAKTTGPTTDSADAFVERDSSPSGSCHFQSDTHADIHALGVLLYELLTGRAPSNPAMNVPDQGTETPSSAGDAKISAPWRLLRDLDDGERAIVARLRSTVPKQLARLLRGDLEWIVMRCLETGPGRRYETVESLGQDLHTYLRNEPLVARPPPRPYHSRVAVVFRTLFATVKGFIAKRRITRPESTGRKRSPP